TFLFFPATAAMFSVVRSWIVEEDFSSTFKKYISHLTSDYKSSVKAGAFFALAWLVWYYNYFYFYSEQNSVAFLFLVIGLGIFISAGRPLTSLAILASSAVLVWISVFQLLWLVPLLVCSLIAFVSFAAFHKATVKISEKAASNTAS